MNNQIQEEKISAVPNELPTEQFKSAGALIKESCKIYKNRLGVFLGIAILPIVLSLLLNFLGIFMRNSDGIFSFVSILFFLFALLNVFFSFLASLALIYAFKDNCGIKESYKKAFKILFSYIWISILVCLIVFGGLVFLIIPGLLFAIWFSLAVYVLVFEEKKGMNALMRSKQLVSGRCFGILWRFFFFSLILIFVLFLILLVLNLIGLSLGTNKIIDNLIESLFSLVVLPLSVIFGSLIYKNLRDIKKEDFYQEPTKNTKIKYTLIGVIGIIVSILLIASMITTFREAQKEVQEYQEKSRKSMNDIEIKEEMTYIMFAGMDIRLEKQENYLSVNCMNGNSKIVDCCDRIKDIHGDYPIVHRTEDKYCAYIELSNGNFFCIDNYESSDEISDNPSKKGYCDGTTFICPGSWGLNKQINSYDDVEKMDDKNDSKRKADLDFITDSLFKYFKDNNMRYPKSIGLEKTNNENCVLHKNLKPYLMYEKIPIDPKDPEFYYYYKSDGKTYELTARLENLEDKDCIIQNNICIYKCKDGVCGVKE